MPVSVAGAVAGVCCRCLVPVPGAGAGAGAFAGAEERKGEVITKIDDGICGKYHLPPREKESRHPLC